MSSTQGPKGPRIGPDRIDPWRAVRSGKTLEGLAGADQLPRVAEALNEHWTGPWAGHSDEHWAETCAERTSGAGTRWPATYRLAFGRDERGMRVVTGEASLTVALPCQRCLEAVEIVLECRFGLGLIESEALAESLPEDLDPVVVGPDELLRPLDLVEDELLLALPLVPRHPEGLCAAATALTEPRPGHDRGPVLGPDLGPDLGRDSPDSDASEAQRPNPFAALAALKNKAPPERDS